MSSADPLSPKLSPHSAHEEMIRHLKPALAYQPGREYRAKALTQLRELIGMPRNVNPTLETQTLWQKSFEHGKVTQFTLEVEPNHLAIAYWCVPNKLAPSPKTFICLQGHNTGMHVSLGIDRETQSKSIPVPGHRDFAIQCMKRGYPALCLEQRAFGYRRENVLMGRKTTETTCHDALVGSLLLGRTLIGERVYDIQCVSQWLAKQSIVDTSQLGVIGQSGGGTSGLFSLALLDEIRFGIASCCFARFADSIAGQHHCCCNVIPDIMNWFEMGDVVALAAPKKLVLVNGIDDSIFPIASAREAFATVQRAYADQNAQQNAAFRECPGGHDFHGPQAWEAFDQMG